jgi:hypothetical protein
MTNDAPILTVEVTRSELARCYAVTPDLTVLAEPIAPVARREGWRTFNIPLVEGTVYQRKKLFDYFPRYAVVQGGRLVDLPNCGPGYRKTLNLIDPAGARRRHLEDLAGAHGVKRTVKRFDVEPGHGLVSGGFREYPNGALAYVERATRAQAWLRVATVKEYDRHYAQQAEEAVSPTP